MRRLGAWFVFLVAALTASIALLALSRDRGDHPAPNNPRLAKSAWLAEHGNEGPDPASLAEAKADTAGQAHSSGVIDSGQSPLDRSVYSIRNSWSGLSASGRTLTLVHGGLKVGTSTAVLVVRDIPWPTDERARLETVAEYPYTCRPGPLRIQGGNATSLKIVDGAGKSAWFSLARRTFAPACGAS